MHQSCKCDLPAAKVGYIMIMTVVSFILTTAMFENPATLQSIATNGILQSRPLVGSQNRLLCWIIISGETDMSNVTWMKDCQETVFLIDNKNKMPTSSYNSAFIDIPPTRTNDSLWIKTRASITQIYKDYLENFDWFLIVNDDTDVTTKTLREFLFEFDASKPQYFGYTWAGLMKTGHRGGFVLSQKAISWLQEVGLSNKNICSGKQIGSERIRACMQQLGIYSGIDPRFHYAFVPRGIQQTASKLVLAWNTRTQHDMPELASQHSKFCPVKCKFSSNKSLFAKADAIVFNIHPCDAAALKEMPPARYPWQRYVFLNHEAYAKEDTPLIGYSMPLFNWSMTYHRDSDIRIDYYGQILKTTQSLSQRDFIHSTAKNKSRMVAWLVSNCETHSQREDYVKELSNYITVDKFGGCGSTTNVTYNCPRQTHYGYWCPEIPFTTDYRFYISFENAACRDYVTEKFYQAMDKLMVPIVMRKADYVDIAPEGSYIAADQFLSPKHLAYHLHYFASNPEMYLQYFEWRKMNTVVWKLDDMLADGICRLCRMLHENRTIAIGKNIRGTWKNDTSCVSGFAKQLL